MENICAGESSVPAGHEMRTAFPGREVARRRGMNRNHHVRVWCTCMDQPAHPPGSYSTRPTAEVLNDPRRLGAWDDLGYADVRVPGQALALWREHIRQEPNDETH